MNLSDKGVCIYVADIYYISSYSLFSLRSFILICIQLFIMHKHKKFSSRGSALQIRGKREIWKRPPCIMVNILLILIIKRIMSSIYVNMFPPINYRGGCISTFCGGGCMSTHYDSSRKLIICIKKNYIIKLSLITNKVGPLNILRFFYWVHAELFLTGLFPSQLKILHWFWYILREH